MSSVEDSPARTSAPQERGPESPENAPACGPRWPGSLARYDPDSRSWRTAQCSLFGGLELFSETWPRWGMMLDGESFPLPTPAHLISGNESGFWPTPTKFDSTNRGSRGAYPGSNHHLASLDWVVQHPEHFRTPAEFVKMFPIPTKSDTGRTQRNAANRIEQGHQIDLSTMIPGALNPMWVEWLMGWPLGWTDLQPLAMDRFRQWCDSHGGC